MKSCKKASFLMSKQLDAPLSLTEKLSLSVHIAMCKNCSRCNQQLKQIQNTCRQRHKKEIEDTKPNR